MSSNFYQAKAYMIGIDLHKYLTVAPPAPLPIPLDYHPHFVHTVIGLGSSLVATVTAGGAAMVHQDSTVGVFESFIPVIHIPWFLPPPHPAEAANVAFIILASSSKAKLGKRSVHATGKPLAVCLFDWFGLNVNCCTVPLFPGPVLSFTTVVTQVEIGDIVYAFLSAVYDFAIGKALDKVFKFLKVKGIVDTILRKFHLRERGFGRVSRAIGKAVVHLAKKLVAKAAKKVAPFAKVFTAIVNSNPVDLPVGAGLL